MAMFGEAEVRGADSEVGSGERDADSTNFTGPAGRLQARDGGESRIALHHAAGSVIAHLSPARHLLLQLEQLCAGGGGVGAVWTGRKWRKMILTYVTILIISETRGERDLGDTAGWKVFLRADVSMLTAVARCRQRPPSTLRYRACGRCPERSRRSVARRPRRVRRSRDPGARSVARRPRRAPQVSPSRAC